jgi:hypothetical protein
MERPAVPCPVASTATSHAWLLSRLAHHGVKSLATMPPEARAAKVIMLVMSSQRPSLVRHMSA